MPSGFSEEKVHQHVYTAGMEALVADAPAFDIPPEEVGPTGPAPYSIEDFQLWEVLKEKALNKIKRLHNVVRYGTFAGSKINLRTDNTKPMQLDLVGFHDNGIFVLELKVNKSAERNAFSELFAYSNYIASMFPGSGHRDITNVLVANLDNKITEQAYLYDLLIADREVLVYRPEFVGDLVPSLKLHLYVPSDAEFQRFTNGLLGHGSMACVATSFHNIPDWIDSADQPGGSPPDYTIKHLSALSNYTSQLMEAEGLHGFCFIRKRWKEVELYYANSMIICAINPFVASPGERHGDLAAQLDPKQSPIFFESPGLGFDGRLAKIAKQAIRDCISTNFQSELEFPNWKAMTTSLIEVVLADNFGFRPTGMLREAYVSYITGLHRHNDSEADYKEDLSVLKILDITNWFRAWQFMEMCGFTSEEME